MRHLFFDAASTTKCCSAAAARLHEFSVEHYGNPSSSHIYGERGAQAIREARLFFAKHFKVEANQVIFTGSGSESDNLAIYGVALADLARWVQKGSAAPRTPRPRVLCSSIEHPAVRSTVLSLESLGFEPRLIPVDSRGRIREDEFLNLLTPETLLVSVMAVNNVVGSVNDVERLAALAKERAPHVFFHTDAVQAFGKVDLPRHPSAVDMISLSAHKIEGPKGVGALILLNEKLLAPNAFRPLIWGGSQEGGLRSGTQSAGLIAAFHAAAELALRNQTQETERCRALKDELIRLLREKELLGAPKSPLVLNSTDEAVPHVVSLSAPGLPSGPLTKLLEERGCLVSAGSACSSHKAEPDHVLKELGLPSPVASSGIRISFSKQITPTDVTTLVTALSESITLISRLLGR